MKRIIELIYCGHVNVPKERWSKFLGAVKLLQINGFEKLGDINLSGVEKEFQMLNCYVKLTDVGKMMEETGRSNESATEIESDTEITPPNFLLRSPHTLPIGVPSTSKTPSNAGSGTANTPPNSVQSTPNTRATHPEMVHAKDDSMQENSQVDAVSVKANKRTSIGHIEIECQKRNRLRLLSTSTSIASDTSITMQPRGKINTKKRFN